MRVVFDEDLKPLKEDFGAVIDGDLLVVPKQLQDAAPNHHTALELFGAMQTFPSSFVEVLEWTLEEVHTARNRLAVMLKGRLPDVILNPPDSPPPRRTYGVSGRPRK
jgi:hypothetical protein